MFLSIYSDYKADFTHTSYPQFLYIIFLRNLQQKSKKLVGAFEEKFGAF
jgi:hypothetical protein